MFRSIVSAFIFGVRQSKKTEFLNYYKSTTEIQLTLSVLKGLQQHVLPLLLSVQWFNVSASSINTALQF